MTITTHISLNGFDRLKKKFDKAGPAAVPAIKKAWNREIKTNLRPKLRRDVSRSFGGKKRLANSYSIRTLSNPTLEMIFYSRADAAIPHEHGGVIRPKKRKFLRIPIAGNRKGVYKNTFMKKTKDGWIVFQKVNKGRKRKDYAKSGYFKKGQRIRRGDVLPLFLLKRSVKLRKRTNVTGFAYRNLKRIAWIAGEAIDDMLVN